MSALCGRLVRSPGLFRDFEEAQLVLLIPTSTTRPRTLHVRDLGAAWHLRRARQRFWGTQPDPPGLPPPSLSIPPQRGVAAARRTFYGTVRPLTPHLRVFGAPAVLLADRGRTLLAQPVPGPPSLPIPIPSSRPRSQATQALSIPYDSRRVLHTISALYASCNALGRRLGAYSLLLPSPLDSARTRCRSRAMRILAASLNS